MKNDDGNAPDSEELARFSAGKLGPLGSLKMEPSPFLKSRVFAQFEQTKAVAPASQAVSGWRGLFALPTSLKLGLGLALTVAIAAPTYLVLSRTTGKAIRTGEDFAMVIRPEEDGKSAKVAFVQLELPEGVKFSSKERPELSEESVLILPTEELGDGRSGVPVVLHADTPGMADVKVRYLDEQSREVKTRIIRLKVVGKGTSL